MGLRVGIGAASVEDWAWDRVSFLGVAANQRWICSANAEDKVLGTPPSVSSTGSLGSISSGVPRSSAAGGPLVSSRSAR
ncbi:MAG: hypothetical protein IPG45_37785 [Deltaproteobacteria bacterium]|nr:hypothetical protein [Deltaproteobacteria bacterium]